MNDSFVIDVGGNRKWAGWYSLEPSTLPNDVEIKYDITFRLVSETESSFEIQFRYSANGRTQTRSFVGPGRAVLTIPPGADFIGSGGHHALNYRLRSHSLPISVQIVVISRTRRVRKGLYGDCLTVPLELKELDEAGAFTGYAAVFNGIDSQNDVVKRGAFTRSLAEHRTAGSMPPLLWMHDASKPIGRLLACREDAKGLFVDGKLTLGVKQADEAYALLREGAVTGLSIGYKTRHSNQDKETGARVLSDVDLREVSLVALPANPAARVEQVKGLGGVRCDLLARVRSNAQELSRLLSLGRLVKGDQRIQMLGCEAISKSAAHDQAVSCRTIE